MVYIFGSFESHICGAISATPTSLPLILPLYDLVYDSSTRQDPDLERVLTSLLLLVPSLTFKDSVLGGVLITTVSALLGISLPHPKEVGLLLESPVLC